jgi:hypothetical protein
MPGFDDMKDRKVLGVNSRGKLEADYGSEGIKLFDLYITPTGGLRVKPLTEPAPTKTIDQEGEREPADLARRLARVDQG